MLNQRRSLFSLGVRSSSISIKLKSLTEEVNYPAFPSIRTAGYGNLDLYQWTDVLTMNTIDLSLVIDISKKAITSICKSYTSTVTHVQDLLCLPQFRTETMINSPASTPASHSCIRPNPLVSRKTGPKSIKCFSSFPDPVIGSMWSRSMTKSIVNTRDVTNTHPRSWLGSTASRHKSLDEPI